MGTQLAEDTTYLPVIEGTGRRAPGLLVEATTVIQAPPLQDLVKDTLVNLQPKRLRSLVEGTTVMPPLAPLQDHVKDTLVIPPQNRLWPLVEGTIVKEAQLLLLKVLQLPQQQQLLLLLLLLLQQQQYQKQQGVNA